MRLLISLLVLVGQSIDLPAQALPYYHVFSSDPGPWPEILSSIGLQSHPDASILVALPAATASPALSTRVDQGAILILEGSSPLADSFGFRPGKSTVRVTSITDVHRPTMLIVWERPLSLPVYDLPPGAEVFARERWTGAPLTAGLKRGAGAVLWLAASPGERGYDHFPYLLESLCDLGMTAPFRSSRLWAFFDSAYRSRVDLDYFAVRWRKSGIAALHVAAWHFYEPDAGRDRYLASLIEDCHREGILVYAWLELPHVSEKFWNDHPEWREKTAVLQDAQLDWRKLMNLANRDCFRAVSAGVGQLLGRFDWDGVNLAELYFESLEGIGNPSRFTPMNGDVRALFRSLAGFDPLELFGARRDQPSRRAFLDFRSALAGRIEREWIDELEAIRRRKPDLDLVLTHVDDRFDTGMRDAIGADAAKVLPLLDQHSFTFLIEDPATVWNLGPQRYQAIAERYRPLTPHGKQLAIDLNIVDRYQNVYPTKQQTGAELLQLVHHAAASFPRVALYFESSLLPPDLRLLPSAAATVTRVDSSGAKLVIDSTRGVGVPWKGAVMVDNLPWPVTDGATIWLPPGEHTLEPAAEACRLHLLRLNGDLETARVIDSTSIEFSYHSAARAIATLDRPPRRVRVDGADIPIIRAGSNTVLLPHGEHTVTITAE